MKENIAILGSTGSIGSQALEVIKQHKDSLRAYALTAGSNTKLLSEQIKQFSPALVSVKNKNSAKILNQMFDGYELIYWGDFGNVLAATSEKVDRVVVATPGLPGIIPTIAAIEAKKKVALATKEVLVAAGNVVMDAAEKAKAQILPIDSEHSAIFQCLQNHCIEQVSKIYLTCSGGPFRGLNTEQLKSVTLQDALNHPNWKMGKKITVDSATLMNKGFEAIEAHWLFGLPMDQINIIIHPQSVIHSAVEFVDGSVIAQMGAPDMRLPIQYALLYPGRRIQNNFRKLSFADYPTLSFEEPDTETFRCLRLAIESAKSGGTYPAVLNVANDIAVEAFLNGMLPFYKIPEVVENVLAKHTPKYSPSLGDIFEADRAVRQFANLLTNLI
ncbi:1-deoxy-D-xylulose-5-phosphate reductoisomerase [Candidatus Daviesbacteria bacterium]|nr:1-deoxy-D-xylulose-5-phosphate reductoisomerase [Candidatus Daviesbacteria bacterium]